MWRHELGPGLFSGGNWSFLAPTFGARKIPRHSPLRGCRLAFTLFEAVVAMPWWPSSLTDPFKACSQTRESPASSLGIRWMRFGLQNGLFAATALILLLGCPQIARAADPYAENDDKRSIETHAGADGWHNGQQFTWVAKQPESSPASASEDVHWFLWAVFAVASFGLSIGVVIALRRWNQGNDRTAAKIDGAESVMAEDPSMTELLLALHEGPQFAAVATGSERSGSRNVGSDPGKAGEDSPALDARSKGLAGAAKSLAVLWADFLRSSRVPGDVENVRRLHQLTEIADRIKEGCGLSHLRPARLLASALQGLLKQLSTRADNVTPSALRTAAAAIDLLEPLCARALRPDLLTEPPLRLLVVDDDPITRGTLSSALRKTFTEPELAPDGKTALILAAQRSYDLVLLDVEMPGLDGFEVCSKIHDTAKNCTTPVVFVTSHNDFDSRAKSALAGAHDLIGKPFLAFEITVKALTLVLSVRLTDRDEKLGQKEIEKPSSGTALHSEGTAGTVPRSSTPICPPATSCEEPSQNANQLKTPPPKRQLDAVGSVSNPGSAPVVTAAKAESLRAAAPSRPQPSISEFARAFFESASTHLQLLRTHLAAARDATQPADRDAFLRELLIGVHTICAQADRAQLSAVLRLGSALEAVVKRLVNRPSYCTAAAALDTIEQLCQSAEDLDLAQAPVCLLVVDDDPVARRAIGGSLQLAFGRPDSADCGEAALVLAAAKPYDLIFVDVLMPGMDGFVTCEKLHELDLNRLTPVVFVTSLDDTNSRAKAAASGGCGFIPKPVLPSEIMLLALTHIARGRLQRRALEPWKDAISMPSNEGVLAGWLSGCVSRNIT
jgi:CheY-like chemotaxis protein